MNRLNDVQHSLRGLSSTIALCTVCLVGPGCVTDEVGPDSVDAVSLNEAQGGEVTDPENIFYTRTSVTVLPDGSYKVHVGRVSLAQQLAEAEAEEAGHPEWAGLIGDTSDAEESEGNIVARSITEDNCSYLASLRQWSNTGYTGNQLCLSGTGDADLFDYEHCGYLGCCYWGAYLGGGGCNVPVKSFKTGSYYVWYAYDEHTWCGVSEYHSSYESVSTASSFVQNSATHVRRGQSCSPTK